MSRESRRARARGALSGPCVSREPLRRALGAPVPCAEPASREPRRAPFRGAAACARAGAQRGSGHRPPRSRRPSPPAAPGPAERRRPPEV
ncbi:unnamed protein product [Bubo scandiacus]